MKKQIIIIIPGLDSIGKWPKTFHPLIKLTSRIIRYPSEIKDPIETWKGKIGKKNEEIIYLHWERNLNPIAEIEAIKKLKELINHYKNYDIKLIGISYGGKIVLEYLKDKNPKNVKKIVLICSVHEMDKLKKLHPPLVNIYSVKDRLAKAGVQLLSLGKNHSERLNGKNITNIVVPGMDHKSFCENKKIEHGNYKGKIPSELINELLK